MLNKTTQQVINQLKDIAPSAIFSYPITGIRDSNKTIIAFVELDKLGEEEFEEFGAIKVREFMDLLSIAGEADTSIKDGVIHIKSKDIACKYVTTDIDILEADFRAKPTMLQKVEEAPTASSFKLTAQELEKIKKISSLLSLDNFIVNSVGDSVTVTVGNDSINTKNDSNEFSIKFSDSIVNEECSVLLSVSNVRKLPSGNYDVKIAKQGNGAVIIRFASESIAGLTIFIATKAN